MRLTEVSVPKGEKAAPKTVATTDTTGEFRGYDYDGHKIIVGWVNADGTEYLVGLTKCCGATAKGCSHGIACRACYEVCSPSLGAEGEVAGDTLEVVGDNRIDDWGFPLTRTVWAVKA